MSKKKPDVFVYNATGFTVTGDCSEYSDLFLREEKRCRSSFYEQPHQFRYIAMVSFDRRISSVSLFTEDGVFSGAGVATRCPTDKYVEEAGLRLAMARALRSIGWDDLTETY